MKKYAVAYCTEWGDLSLKVVEAADEVLAIRDALGECDEIDYASVEEAKEYYGEAGWLIAVVDC